MSSKLIELIDVSKHYIKQLHNITIKKGDFWLITGSNGSGKTTLLRFILNFLRPDQGSIIRNKSLKIAYLPEKVVLPGYLLVINYLEMIAKIKKIELNLELILRLEIPLYKRIDQLSKGNYQKVAIISTLIGDSNLVLLDEPLSGLDNKTINILKKIIKEFHENFKTFIISTHNPKVFLKMSNNLYEL